jgi:hypothetical protein
MRMHRCWPRVRSTTQDVEPLKVMVFERSRPTSYGPGDDSPSREKHQESFYFDPTSTINGVTSAFFTLPFLSFLQYWPGNSRQKQPKAKSLKSKHPKQSEGVAAPPAGSSCYHKHQLGSIGTVRNQDPPSSRLTKLWSLPDTMGKNPTNRYPLRMTPLQTSQIRSREWSSGRRIWIWIHILYRWA